MAVGCVVHSRPLKVEGTPRFFSREGERYQSFQRPGKRLAKDLGLNVDLFYCLMELMQSFLGRAHPEMRILGSAPTAVSAQVSAKTMQKYKASG